MGLRLVVPDGGLRPKNVFFFFATFSETFAEGPRGGVCKRKSAKTNTATSGVMVGTFPKIPVKNVYFSVQK